MTQSVSSTDNAATQAVATTTTHSDFTQLGLIPELLETLKLLSYTTPTAIQSHIIPAVLEGRDVLGGAKTGSGKTAAFALPIIQKLAQAEPRKAGSNFVSCLVLVPTRELAQQVSDSFMRYSQLIKPNLKTLAVYGGVSTNVQMQSLRGGADIVVATPGRLIDLISSNALKLDKTTTLVLDEADRMLSLGFTDELNALLAKLPKTKQTLLFSATFPEEVRELTQSLLSNPVEVQLQSSEESTLVQRVITVNRNRKTALLAELIKQNQWQQVLIFASAKYSCNRLAQKLENAGITAEVFHSDKGQGARNRVLEGFKSGEISVLIATDIAARGIDIEKLPIVINFELPRSPADYMHRIGRSGRAGEAGLAMSLISHDEYQHFKLIEKKNKLRLEREQIPGFEADLEAPADCPSREVKPMAKPAGTGKKHRKKVNAEVWGKKS
ncbi:DEAD/DEAH box helicase [Shewanella schlegeliana]|uniref:DEAD/DEAH box helicase n=1 Tax=Shewanella schlegeliana TaxID=190308 RepID=A0ABS1SWJ1_9GAMM|nr:DEAD/DEAH box helicase [Shewanella schlegeliana]MBL4911676.1 DEAD/DEAH box helicase [Shewanella schlegeliana]MCL1110372.1 DEAD/DEAH box helicase [Shewanella schlegeliana]GIU31211.1 RNA helicase [Shewanella schlegeliana]